MNLVNGHVGELALRRRRAGEAAGDEGAAIDAHARGCADCRARLRALEDEQRRFEEMISFDRFEAGVARAGRDERKHRAARRVRRSWNWGGPAWLIPAAGLGGAVVILAGLGPRSAIDHQPRPSAAAPSSAVERRPSPSENRVKGGGAGMQVRIAGPGGQRDARVDGPEPLARGERLRIGYQSGGHRYLLSLSIDDRGEVTPLYPESGRSLPVPGPNRDGEARVTRFLPDSVELTGAGAERIILVLSDDPLEVEAARRAARAAFDLGGGELDRLPRLELPGEQFVRTFTKP